MSLVKEGRTDEAALAAECGRALSRLEQGIYHYFITMGVIDVKAMKLKFKPGNHPLAPSAAQIEKTRLSWMKRKNAEEQYLCSVFLDAIRARDGNKIWEIAQAVWFLKGVFESKSPADTERAHLLSIKQYLDMTGLKWNIQTVVSSLESATGKKIKDQGDGFSALRAKCKAIGLPLAKSRRGRRKKAS